MELVIKQVANQDNLEDLVKVLVTDQPELMDQTLHVVQPVELHPGVKYNKKEY